MHVAAGLASKAGRMAALPVPYGSRPVVML